MYCNQPSDRSFELQFILLLFTFKNMNLIELYIWVPRFSADGELRRRISRQADRIYEVPFIFLLFNFQNINEIK